MPMTKSQAIAELKAAGAEKVEFKSEDEIVGIGVEVDAKHWSVGARADEADFATMVAILKLLMPRQIEIEENASAQ